MIDRPPRSRHVVRPALLLPLAFALGLSVRQTAQAGDDTHRVAWRTDLAQAQQEARSRNVLLWLQFTGPWCINCRRMDRATFVHGAVVTESRERFVPIKLRSDEHENLALSLGLSSLPASVIVRPNGEVVQKIEGYSDPEAFTGFLLAALDREGRLPGKPGQGPGAGESDARTVALAGHCPVSLLRERKLVAGQSDFATRHDGQVFHFASAAHRAEFLRRPDVYTPANGGRCPVSQVDGGNFLAGDPRWGIVYGGHLFLFKDAAIRERFARDPERYAPVDVAGRESCPHCRGLTQLVAGRPARFSSSTLDGAVAPAGPPRLEAMLMSDTIRR